MPFAVIAKKRKRGPGPKDAVSGWTIGMIFQTLANKSMGLIYAVALLILIAANTAYTGEPNKRQLFSGVKQHLLRDGFAPERIEAIYRKSSVQFDVRYTSILFLYREAHLDYDQFSAPASIKLAQQYMQRHQPTLDRIEKAYGVDKEIITAIILVETKMGQYMGKIPVINTFSTLAALAEPVPRNIFWTEISKSKKLSRKRFEIKATRKAKWAYEELKAFLTYAESEKFNPIKLQGSIAGAIGIAQFLPSSIIAYGRDGNNDGRIDLSNHIDAIASIANYLKKFGCRPEITRPKAARVIWRYNHSQPYVDSVLKVATLLKG